MLTDTDAAAMIGATSPPTKKESTVEIDKEAAWKSEFRQMLAEIKDKGFGAYAEEIRVEKLKEMREEILEAMALNDEKLAELSPEQRAAIERAINMEIQKRLTAERALEEDDPANAAATAGIGQLLEHPGTAPNIGVGLAVLQVIEAAEQAQTDREKSDKTG